MPRHDRRSGVGQSVNRCGVPTPIGDLLLICPAVEGSFSDAYSSIDIVTLVHLPACALELNPIENVSEYLRGNRLAITVFDDYGESSTKPVQHGTSSPRSKAHRFHHRSIMGNGQSLGSLVQ